MQKYFNVFLEFDHNRFHSVIKETIATKGKGYICVIDANVLTMAQNDFEYRSVLNNSMVNTCDGSSIAVMASWIHKTKFQALNGPEIFESYIEMPYKQVLLGNTEAIVERIKNTLISKGKEISFLHALPLPFVSVDEFDYVSIAAELNILKPDIIWVSLGAPKQEKFMFKLLPFLEDGVMFGIGAAFNFYIGELNVPRIKIGRLKFIWLNRLYKEPGKLTIRLLRYLMKLPGLYLEERKVFKNRYIY